MGSHRLPSPPAERAKTTKNVGEPAKPSNRGSKLISSTDSGHHRNTITGAASIGSRHKRAWKACERCRAKKTKCDGVFPCKRCKEDGLVCTASIRKRMIYKQLPKGYAEVLENTHLTLIATIHKLYSMVRHSKPWEHGEPGFNCLGQPVVQSIAQKLGCLRINHDIDLPVDSAFPEDESSMAELSRQLEEQQAHEQDAATSAIRAYNRAAPQSFASDNDFGSSKTLANLESTAISSAHSSSMPDFSSSCASVAKTEQQNSHNAISVLFTQQTSLLQNLAMMRQDALDVDFGTTKPDSLFYANADVTMGMADFVIYPNCDNESK